MAGYKFAIRRFFFRIEGGGAQSFDTNNNQNLQPQNLQYHKHPYIGPNTEQYKNVTIGGQNDVRIDFVNNNCERYTENLANTGETRPVNKTIQVDKRTA